LAAATVTLDVSDADRPDRSTTAADAAAGPTSHRLVATAPITVTPKHDRNRTLIRKLSLRSRQTVASFGRLWKIPLDVEAADR